MAISESKRNREPRERPGFDVLCVVGRVEFGDTGEDPPYVAAFRLIGEHGAVGTYEFPTEDGLTCRVAVDHLGPDHHDGEPAA
jgi:hypothetical protein